ncbi:NAD-dependent epimerase/dehydratase family protein [Allopusillimonas soli]|uniref:NAD-dependent epimerase/dehydratase family protein n=1 Tax=Allopusillimonas soli TaxID=659016 RepID=A0A853F781_9BURK|nr:NAD-dependent epimerase/dehydratase family protein [Allopusillimonas soli]NYT36445.1 NAD-dependent epimerase/dehydratase family protein [Allopusillimonas soli]TEA74954.1 NAD-dependent epimerase/dehydratase family protein [Allopusillimonas soli]
MNQINDQDALSAKRVVVVGGNGFIGRHIVKALQKEDAQVSVIDVCPISDDSSFKVETIIGSINDSTLFSSAIAGSQIVIFLANNSLPGSANFDLASEVRLHVEHSIKAADLCRTQGVEKFIFSSSGGTVYGYSSDVPLSENMLTRPINAYGVSKLSIENYLRIISMQSSMRTISIRISNPYGEGQRAIRNQGFIAAAMEHGINDRVLPIWGDGTVERDFIYIDDVARAFILACKSANPPDVVNIGSGQPYSLLEIIKLSENALEREIKIEFHSSRTVDVQRNYLDITRAEEKLGWHPNISIEEGLRRTAKWWKNISI